MEPYVINLHFDRKHFEDFYFKDGHEKLFFSPTVKKDSKLALVCFGIFITVGVYHLITQQHIGALIVSAVVLLISLIQLGRNLYVVLKWKKSVKDYLDEVSTYKSNKIILTEQTFTLVRDEHETIVKWSSFKRLDITPLMVSFIGETSFAIPQRAMSESEYKRFYEIIKEKIGQSS